MFKQLRNYSQAHITLKKKLNLLHVVKNLIFQTQKHPPPKTRGKYGSKRHENYTKTSQIRPVAFIRGLHKNHFVIYSKLVEVHEKK